MFEREKILFEGDTEFEHYQVVEMNYEGRRARVLFSGNRDAAFSGVPLDDQHDLLFDYIQRFYELVATTRPRKLLMIGGGVYTLPLALLHALPDLHMDVVEIDPGLDSIAEAFFGLQPHDRLKIIHQDGKNFLKETAETYDMILIDAFTQLQVPKSLASPDTAALIKQHLSKNGIMAMNIISSYHGRRAEAIRHFYNLYEQVFDFTTVYPADSATSLWQSQNFILTAQKGRKKQNYGFRFGELERPL